MNTKRSVTWGLLGGAVACAAMAAMSGCELIVDFDRSLIPTADASLDDVETPDATTSEASPDGASAGEGGPVEAAAEAGSMHDAGPMPDAGPDATMADAGATPDADAAVVEASIPDAVADVGTPSDAGPEAGEE